MSRKKKLILDSLLILLVVIAAYAAGILIPDSAVEPDFMNARLAPSLAHPFGTDWVGRREGASRALMKSGSTAASGIRMPMA